MQRKNNILKSSSKSAFAMIMAMAVIVVISGIMALSLSLGSQTVKRTGDLYLYEQAQIYTKSAAELALLEIARMGPCAPNNISGTFGLNGIDFNVLNDIFIFNVDIKYIYTGTVPADSPCATAIGTDYTRVNRDEQNGSVLMDITISTTPTASTESIRVFKRTMQKL